MTKRHQQSHNLGVVSTTLLLALTASCASDSTDAPMNEGTPKPPPAQGASPADDGPVTQFAEFEALPELSAKWALDARGDLALNVQDLDPQASIQVHAVVLERGLGVRRVKDVVRVEPGQREARVQAAELARLLGAPLDARRQVVYLVAEAKLGGRQIDSLSSELVSVAAGGGFERLTDAHPSRVWSQDRVPELEPELARIAEARSLHEGLLKRSREPASPQKAAAVNVTLCFSKTTQYQDAGVGEDYWTENRTPVLRALSGIAVSVDGGAVDFADALGCKAFTLTPGNHNFTVSSWGRIGASRIDIGDLNESNPSGPEWQNHQDLTWTHNVSTAAVQSVQINALDPFSKLNVYPTVAAALFNNNGDTYNYRFQVKPADGSGGAVTSASSTRAQIRMAHSFQDNKWVVLHELGHAYMRAASGFVCPVDYSFSASGTGCGTGAGHNFDSLEFAGSALAEGFAHFYAAMAWNDSSLNANCFNEGGRDCGSGTSALPEATMKTKCTGAAPWSGLGVEWDWTRLFWDIKTHKNTAGVQPTMQDIRNLLFLAQAAGGVDVRNVYTKLDNAANLLGEPLNSVWDKYKVVNGVNAP